MKDTYTLVWSNRWTMSLDRVEVFMITSEAYIVCLDGDKILAPTGGPYIWSEFFDAMIVAANIAGMNPNDHDASAHRFHRISVLGDMGDSAATGIVTGQRDTVYLRVDDADSVAYVHLRSDTAIKLAHGIMDAAWAAKNGVRSA